MIVVLESQTFFVHNKQFLLISMVTLLTTHGHSSVSVGCIYGCVMVTQNVLYCRTYKGRYITLLGIIAGSTIWLKGVVKGQTQHCMIVAAFKVFLVSKYFVLVI